MNKMELLASDIALLSNKSIQELVAILVRDYPTRADHVDMSLRSEYIDRENAKIQNNH